MAQHNHKIDFNTFWTPARFSQAVHLLQGRFRLNNQDAEECVSDAMTALWRRQHARFDPARNALGAIDLEKAYWSWATQVLESYAKKLLAKEKRRRRLAAAWFDSPSSSAHHAPDSERGTATASAESLDDHDRHARLEHASAAVGAWHGSGPVGGNRTPEDFLVEKELRQETMEYAKRVLRDVSGRDELLASLADRKVEHCAQTGLSPQAFDTRKHRALAKAKAAARLQPPPGHLLQGLAPAA